MRRKIQIAITVLSIFACPALVQGSQSVDITDVAVGNNPSLASDQQGHLYAAFESHETGSAVKDIFFTKSADAAKTWASPIDVSKTPGNSSHPAIAVERDGAIDVVWSDTTSGVKSPDIFFTRSTNGGKAWSKALDISGTPGVSSNPALATGPNNSIHVVWEDTSSAKTPEIYYCSSTDGGHKWSNAKDVSNTPAVEPAIAVDAGGLVHLTWLDGSPTNTHPDIYYTQSLKGSWNKPINVSHSPRVSAHPSLACGANGKVFIAWVDNSQKEKAPDIWCAVSKKVGEFSKPLNLSDTPGVSSDPQIVADSTGRVAAVWSDTSSGAQGPDIFATVSFDGLAKVSSAMDLTSTKGASKHPRATLGTDNMVVIWEEIEGVKSVVKVMSKGFPHQ